MNLRMRAKHLTIMLTDIKGFTSRTARQSRAGTVALIKKHQELVLPVIERFHGVMIKSIGDAFLATFESPTDAVLCGLAIQETLRAYNASSRPGENIEIRIAVNSGEVSVSDDGDIYGEAVNVTARLENIAETGEVFVTETVYLTMNRNEACFKELGYHKFKGIPEKVKVFKVLRDKPSGNDGRGDMSMAKAGSPADEEADIKPAAGKDKTEARQYFADGLKYYLNDLEFAEATNAMREAVEIDPFFIEAYFLQAIIAKYGVGDDLLLTTVLNKLKKLRSMVTSDMDRDRIDIALGRFELNPLYRKLLSRYSRHYPEDVLAILAWVFNPDLDMRKMRESFNSLQKQYPFITDTSLLLTESECEFYHNGKIEKRIEILEKLVLSNPGNVNLRLDHIQVLFNAGRLDEASRQIEEGFKAAPTNEYLHRMAATLAFLKKDMAAWFKLIGKQISMTRHDDSTRSELYYEWYLACADAGRANEAEKHLKAARKYGPEWQWRSLDEAREGMEKLKLSDSLFGLSRPVLDLVTDRLISLNYNDLAGCRLTNHERNQMNLFIMDGSGLKCRRIRIWSHYNYSLREKSKSYVFSDSIPVSAYFNADGDVLKCDFPGPPVERGWHSTVITCENPLEKNRIEFLAAEFDAGHSVRLEGTETMTFSLKNMEPNWGTKAYMILLPKNLKADLFSEPPDEILMADGYNVLVYVRFQYALQTFSLDIPLRKSE